MPWIAAGASLLGGYLSGKANQNAAETSANAQLKAAQLAAEASKFRPVGVTTRFGSSNFQFNPQGYLTGAGYNVAPEMQNYQNRLMGLSNRGLTQAELAPQQYAPLQQAAGGLFNLGQQYLAQSPQQVAADYIAKQQDLLAPSRERQLSQLQNTLYQQGRGGLSVGGTGLRPTGGEGLRATNPEMEAYYNAIAQQDAQLAANAQQAGQQNVAFGTGLFNQGAGLLGQYQTGQVGALAPFQGYLNTNQAIEQMAQQPLTLGAGLGGQAAAYGANVGQSLLSGGLSAAKTNYLGNAGSGWGSALSGFASSPYMRSTPSASTANDGWGWGGGSDAYLGKSSDWGFDPTRLFNW